MSIRLHPEYGLNPTVVRCYFCNREKGEVALLGAAYKAQAPSSMVLNKEPCAQCLELMGKGVILISVRDPLRRCECLECKHKWTEYLKKDPSTIAISGEPSLECPKCGSRNTSAGKVQEVDADNPYRTGGWVVVTEDFIKRIISSEDALAHILECRMSFVPNTAWKMMGLPGPIEEPS